MIRPLVGAGVVLLFTYGAFGQGAARPEFEVGNIKLTKSGETAQTGGILPGGQLSIRNVTMSALLQLAFQVRPNYIGGAAPWFESDRFDIIAKTPAGTPEDKIPAMVETLLIQEFKLATHQEQRPMDVYVLTAAKGGPKLQKAAAPGALNCKRTLQAQPAEKDAARPFVEGTFELTCTNMTMALLGDVLQSYAPGYVNRSVVDQTGLEGAYDIKLNWAPRTLIDKGGLTMFDAVDKMLGLKLESKKLPMPVVVIDHVEKLADN